ncbi:MAG: aspartyl protease [Candidatus Saccharimonas sp.]|nr:aspartyl protease [Planctomycetaceae bacterium]
MSMFHVNVVAIGVHAPELCTPSIQVMVDTGSELSWLPSDLLSSAGIAPLRKRTFATAPGQHVERDIGYAILRVDRFETVDEVVFAQPGDMHLLGVRTLEGFGVMVDNIGHRLVATTTLVV